MNKIDKIKQYLETDYVNRTEASTGSLYYTSLLFTIRFSNHLPGNANKTDMYIPINTDSFTICMGYSVYVFESAKKVIEFIKSIELALPIVKGMRFENPELSVFRSGEINEMISGYKSTINGLNRKISNLPEIKSLQESISAIKPRNAALTKQNNLMRELLTELKEQMDETQLKFFNGREIKFNLG